MSSLIFIFTKGTLPPCSPGPALTPFLAIVETREGHASIYEMCKELFERCRRWWLRTQQQSCKDRRQAHEAQPPWGLCSVTHDRTCKRVNQSGKCKHFESVLDLCRSGSAVSDDDVQHIKEIQSESQQSASTNAAFWGTTTTTFFLSSR